MRSPVDNRASVEIFDSGDQMNKLTQMLLASTCLTVLTSGSAGAVPTNEVEPNDTLATANAVPLGTTEILATAERSTIDFFSLSGLDPGETFTAIIARQSVDILDGFFFETQFTARDSGGAAIVTETLGDPSAGFVQTATVTGAIPPNGILVLNTAGTVIEGGPVGYNITITAPLAVAVPQSHTLGLLGAGLAALAGLAARTRRKRD